MLEECVFFIVVATTADADVVFTVGALDVGVVVAGAATAGTLRGKASATTAMSDVAFTVGAPDVDIIIAGAATAGTPR